MFLKWNCFNEIIFNKIFLLKLENALLTHFVVFINCLIIFPIKVLFHVLNALKRT